MAREPSGRLVAVDVRSVWEDEARSFTPWLASQEGLGLLSETLGLELELEATEVSVGPYSADIVAVEAGISGKIVIENQLNKTDHDHLGKILTYASGLNASVAIWIADEFTDEHRRVLDFLNEAAAPKLQLFGIEVRLWRIGNSPPAPQFQVVVRPNEYTQSIRTGGDELSGAKALYLEFWQGLRDYMLRKGTILKPRKPRGGHWYSFSVGKSHFNIHLIASTANRRIACSIYIGGERAKAGFALLREDKVAIEKELGELTWMELPEKQDSRIIQRKRDIDVANKDNWQSCYEWLTERGESFHRVFSPRIKALELPEMDAEEEPEDEGERQREQRADADDNSYEDFSGPPDF